MDEFLANPAMRLFAVCSLILVLKMLATGTYTSTLRIRRKVYATPEDAHFQGLTPAAAPDEDIERVRRAHRNDLENILPFFAVGVFYVLSGPSMLGAKICFIGFTTARILHTLFYVRSMQPHRTIAFGIGYLLMLYMAIAALVSIA